MSTILSPFRKPTDLSNKGMFIFNFLGYIESNELKFSKELLDEEIKIYDHLTDKEIKEIYEYFNIKS